MALTATQVQQAYIAFFNRPADPDGLEHWKGASTAQEMIAQFADAEEYTQLYDTSSNEEMVASVYQNLFGREADEEGQAFWVAALEEGRLTIGEVALTMLEEAGEGDSALIANKVSAATAFTSAVADGDAEYSTAADVTAAREMLADITAESTDEEIDAAVAQGVAAVAADDEDTGGDTGDAGVSGTLTENQDIILPSDDPEADTATFNSTANDDTFSAVVGTAMQATDRSTLNSSDIIDGGAGNDRLAVNLTGNYQGTARIEGVEELYLGTNVTAAGITFDYNVNAGSVQINDVQEIWADQIDVNETLTVANVLKTGDDLPAFGWDNETDSLSGTFNVGLRTSAVSGDTAATLILDDVRNGDFNITTAGVETLTVVSQGAGDTNSIQRLNNAGLTTVNIQGDDNLGGGREIETNGLEQTQDPLLTNTEHTSFVQLGNTVATVNAAQEGNVMAGDVFVQFTDNDNTTYTGGTGADHVIYQGGNVTFSGGEGADVAYFTGTNTSTTGTFFNNDDTVTGGEGEDTILFNYDTANALNLSVSEWLNVSGVDTLDVRSTNSSIELDDAFVGRADQDVFTVYTNKIIQNDSTTNSVNSEAVSNHTIDLTSLNASRSVSLQGGEGQETVIVDDNLNGSFTVSGGNNNDMLVVENGAVLTGQDLQNVSGMNSLNLVKTTTGSAQTYRIDLDSAFIGRQVDANAGAGVSATANNVFQIVTHGTDANGTNLSGVQQLTNTDTVAITVNTAGLGNGSVNINDVIASGANVTVTDTTGAVLLQAANGTITTQPGTSIFAGATSTAVDPTAAATQAAGVGTAQATNNAPATGGTGGTGGTTVALTANADTPALTAGDDTINGTLLNTFGGAADQIVDTGGTDTLNAFISAAPAVGTVVSGIENVNLTVAANVALNAATFAGTTALDLSSSIAGNTVTLTNVTGATAIGLTQTTVLGTTGVAPNLTMSSAAAGNSDAATVALKGGVNSTVNVDPNTNASDIDQLTLNSTGSSANMVTLDESFVDEATESLTVTGAQDLTITNTTAAFADLTGATVAAGNHTGALTLAFTADNPTGTDDTLNANNFTGVDTIVLGSATNNSIDNNTAANTAGETVSNLQSGTTVSLNGAAANATDDLFLTVRGSGGSDAATLNLNNQAANTGITMDAVSFNGIENFTIASNGNGANTIDELVNTGVTSLLTITGSQNLTITNALDANGQEPTNVNASTLTGSLNITGGAAASIIAGGSANDVIVGGNGIDSLTGNGGSDTFGFNGITAAANANNITDFQAGTGGDVLRFDVATFTDYGAGATVTFGTAAAATAGANAAADNVILRDTAANIATYNSADATQAVIAIATDTGDIYYDADGDFTGGTAVVIGSINEAQVEGLVAGNFLFV